MVATYGYRNHKAFGIPHGYYDILEHEDGAVLPHVVAMCWNRADAVLVVQMLNMITPEQRLECLRSLPLEMMEIDRGEIG